LADNIRTFYPKKIREIVLRAPLGTNGWVGPFTVQSQAWAPIFPNASAILQAEYFTSSLNDRDNLYVYTAYFYSDRTFREVLDSKNSLYDPTIWKQSEVKTIEIKTGDDETMLVYEMVLRAGAISRLVWYWYYVAGVSTIDIPLANLLDGVRVVAKYAQGSGVVLISTLFNASPDEGRERLDAFVKEMYDSLDTLKRPEINYKSSNQSGK
jgi:EpsI family protein